MSSIATFQKNDIYIRVLTDKDINDRYLSWFNDNKVTKFLDAKNLSRKKVLKYIEEGKKTGSYYIFAICLKNNDLHIGNIKIGPIKRKDGVSDLVTVVGDSSYWGKGIARLAIIQAVNIGFNQGGIRKFSASINSLNSASVKAYTGAGLKVEAIIKNYFYNNIENKIIISDKVFVGCENKNFNMNVIKDWSPFL